MIPFAAPLFWTAVLKVVGGNVVSSGDNAVATAGMEGFPQVSYALAAAGAAFVVVAGQWLAGRVGARVPATERPAR